MKKTRVLVVYDDQSLSTETLVPLIDTIKEVFRNDELPIYHVGISNLSDFLKDAGIFSHVFFQKNLSIKHYFENDSLMVEGVSLSDIQVGEFLKNPY